MTTISSGAALGPGSEPQLKLVRLAAFACMGTPLALAILVALFYQTHQDKEVAVFMLFLAGVYGALGWRARSKPSPAVLGLALAAGVFGALLALIFLVPSLLQFNAKLIVLSAPFLISNAALAWTAFRAFPAAPLATGPADGTAKPPRSLTVFRNLVWITLGFIVAVFGATFFDERSPCTPSAGGWPAAVALSALPYAGMLFLLRRGRVRQALSLATGWGVLGFVLPLSLNLGMTFHVRYVTSAILAGLGGLLIAPLQAVLMWTATTTHAALGRRPGEMRSAAIWFLAGVPFFIFLLVVGRTGIYVPQDRGASAVGALRTLNTVLVNYASNWEGFAADLSELGPPPEGESATSSAADLIDPQLASGAKGGYRFVYSPAPADDSGHIRSYTIVAEPVQRGPGSCRSFFTDESGVIRGTAEPRSASINDPPIS